MKGRGKGGLFFLWGKKRTVFLTIADLMLKLGTMRGRIRLPGSSEEKDIRGGRAVWGLKLTLDQPQFSACGEPATSPRAQARWAAQRGGRARAILTNCPRDRPASYTASLAHSLFSPHPGLCSGHPYCPHCPSPLSRSSTHSLGPC